MGSWQIRFIPIIQTSIVDHRPTHVSRLERRIGDFASTEWDSTTSGLRTTRKLDCGRQWRGLNAGSRPVVTSNSDNVTFRISP